MNEGDTFFANLPPNDSPHLFVVISDPNKDSERVVVAPLMTVDSCSYSQELVCELAVGDHPFVRHASFINFYCCFSPSLDKIKSIKLPRKSAPVSAEILLQILAGAKRSELLKLQCLDILETQGLSERLLSYP